MTNIGYRGWIEVPGSTFLLKEDIPKESLETQCDL